jgi:hypothetical protein
MMSENIDENSGDLLQAMKEDLMLMKISINR